LKCSFYRIYEENRGVLEGKPQLWGLYCDLDERFSLEIKGNNEKIEIY